MSKAILIIEDMPNNCEECPLFVSGNVGLPSFCIMDTEYTEEEINAEEDGDLEIYYHGCLSERPKACPLKKSEVEE